MPRLFFLLIIISVAVAGCGPGRAVPKQEAVKGTATERAAEAPKDAGIEYFVQGQMLMDKGEVEAALAELAQAVKVDPELSIAHATMGDIYRHKGDWEMARRSYESACQSNPFTFTAHYNLGLTYQMLAETAHVAEKVEEYLKRAIDVYMRAITLQPTDFDSNLNLSACYFELSQADEAEKYCRAAIEINPKNAKALANLGTIKDSQDDLYEAIKSYKASLELDMHQPELLLNLGSAYMRQGRLKQALRSFEQAAAEDPNSSTPLEKSGACYFYMRDFTKAQESYQKALELNASSAPAHRGLGVAYMSQFITDKVKTEMRDKALEEWNASLEIQPDQEDLKRLVQKYTPALEEPKL